MLLVPLICLPLRNLVSRNAWNIMLLCIHLSSCFLWLIPRFFKIISKWFLFQVFPNACFAWVKDADHLLHIEKPNEFNGTIINFLESWLIWKKKRYKNKNSMTNLQHFVWLLQYRLAILTSSQDFEKQTDWILCLVTFSNFPRNSLSSLFCF